MGKEHWDGFTCAKSDRTRDRDIDPEARRQQRAARQNEAMRERIALANELGISLQDLEELEA